MKKKMRRVLSVFLSVFLLVSLFQGTALAAGSSKTQNGTVTSTEKAGKGSSTSKRVSKSKTPVEAPGYEDEYADTVEVGQTEALADVEYPATILGDTIDGISVSVDAPEGAFPKDTTMTLASATDEAVSAAMEAVDNATGIVAVDITFFDADGNEIQPNVPINVKIEAADLEEAEAYSLVHVDSDDNATVVAEEDIQNIDNTGAEFTAAEFSTYAIIATKPALMADDNVINVSLRTLAVNNTKAPAQISASKDLADNGDGTQKLSLSVTGAAESDEQTTVNKSNVVIVIDVSGSMADWVTDYGTFTSYQYVPYTYDSITYSSDERYYGYVNGYRIELDRNNSNTGWVYSWGGRTYNYNDQVYWRVSYRLEATQAAAYELIDALLANNKDQDGLRDIMEISLVKFARKNQTGSGNNYQNGTEVLVSKSNSASDLKTAIKNLRAGGGTNWESAMQTAKAEADKISAANETTSVIFLTDGKPTLYGNDNGGGGEGNDNVRLCWGEAKDDARAIVTAGYDLYNIFAFGSDSGTNSGSNYLKAFTNYAYTGTGTYSDYASQTYTDYGDGTSTTEDFFYDAGDTEELIKAFKAIIDKINNKVGFGGVEVEDGVTMGVTNTSVVVDGTVHEGSFTYTVTNGNATVYTVKIENNKATFTIGDDTYENISAVPVITKIDPDDEDTWITSQVYSVTVGEGENEVTYKMSPATINKDTGLIEWDLAGLGILEDGYTYTLSFDVWPNQKAYDLMADLNNGVITLAEAEAAEQDRWDEIAESVVVTFEDGTSKLISELTAEEKAAISDGIHKCAYAIYTNWKQEVNYYTAEEVTDSEGNVISTEYTPQTPKQLTRPNAIALTSSTMDLRKIWADELDSSQLQRLLYGKDGKPTKYKVDLKVWKADTLAALNGMVEADGDNYYKAVTLGWNESKQDYVWDDALDVAPGIMLDEAKLTAKGLDPADYTSVTYNGTKYYILESGHYYTVSEVTEDYHFDLVTIVYHPMIVNGELSNVTFKADGTVEKISPMSTVDATNTLRGGINLKKVVLDPEGNEYPTEDKFTFTVVLENDDAIFVGQNIPWYGVNGMYYHDANGNYISESATGDQDEDGLEDDGNIPAVSNGGKTATYTLTIDCTDSVRINNVPLGTTYTITEAAANGFTLKAIDQIIKLGDDEEAGDGTVTLAQRKIVGEIEPNRENNITFKNQMTSWPAFYVYHSSDNTIEKIFANDDRVTRSINEDTGYTELSFNIVEEVKTGNLYGGYFADYADKKLTDAEIIALDYDETGSSGGVYTDAEKTDGIWNSDAEGKEYTGSNASAWKSTKQYYPTSTRNKGAIGTAMNPVSGKVYYLKEVPDQYFRPSVYYTYDSHSVNHEIKKMYLLVPTDDALYAGVGSVDASVAGVATKLYSKFTATWPDGKTVTIVARDSDEDETTLGVNTYIPRGYLTVTDAAALIKKDSKYTWNPYLVTKDGVKVTSAITRTIKITGEAYNENLTVSDEETGSKIIKE